MNLPKAEEAIKAGRQRKKGKKREGGEKGTNRIRKTIGRNQRTLVESDRGRDQEELERRRSN